MTPKQKAEELVDIYFITIVDDDFWSDYYTIAKRCASIAVDEILSMGIMSDSGHFRMAKSYWEEVKQEIKKL
jgi:hypothetical protein